MSRRWNYVDVRTYASIREVRQNTSINHLFFNQTLGTQFQTFGDRCITTETNRSTPHEILLESKSSQSPQSRYSSSLSSHPFSLLTVEKPVNFREKRETTATISPRDFPFCQQQRNSARVMARYRTYLPTYTRIYVHIYFIYKTYTYIHVCIVYIYTYIYLYIT